MISKSEEEALTEFCRFNGQSIKVTFYDIGDVKEINLSKVMEYK